MAEMPRILVRRGLVSALSPLAAASSRLEEQLVRAAGLGAVAVDEDAPGVGEAAALDHVAHAGVVLVGVHADLREAAGARLLDEPLVEASPDVVAAVGGETATRWMVA